MQRQGYPSDTTSDRRSTHSLVWGRLLVSYQMTPPLPSTYPVVQVHRRADDDWLAVRRPGGPRSNRSLKTVVCPSERSSQRTRLWSASQRAPASTRSNPLFGAVRFTSFRHRNGRVTVSEVPNVFVHGDRSSESGGGFSRSVPGFDASRLKQIVQLGRQTVPSRTNQLNGDDYGAVEATLDQKSFAGHIGVSGIRGAESPRPDNNPFTG